MPEMNFDYRMLADDDFSAVAETLRLGFSDYFIKIELDEEGCRRKFALEGVDLSYSVGVFDKDRMIGTTVNGTGMWNGLKTVYDAGTAVIPEFRKKGASTAMFEYLLPRLAANGFERYLLEVLHENEPALKLYRKLGFQPKRNLGVFALKSEIDAPNGADGVELRRIKLAELEENELFHDSGLTWQNSNKWLQRADKIGYSIDIVGLFVNGKLLGFGAAAPHSGKVQRVVVSDAQKGKGFGRMILDWLSKRSEKPLLCVNLDISESGTTSFLEACGFEKTVEQFEMELEF